MNKTLKISLIVGGSIIFGTSAYFVFRPARAKGEVSADTKKRKIKIVK